MKKTFRILLGIILVGFLVFLWMPHKTIITSTDIETGKVDTLNKQELDKRHQESWNKFGK